MLNVDQIRHLAFSFILHPLSIPSLFDRLASWRILPIQNHLRPRTSILGGSYPYKSGIAYKESLCQLVEGGQVQVWNNDWISSRQLLAALDPKGIVDERKLKSLKPVVKPAEIRVYAYE